TRDHARTFGRRLDEHTARAVLADQLVRQRIVDERDANQVLLRRLDAFLDRQRHFARLAGAEAHVPTLVAYDNERGERKVLAALNYFGDAIDGDHLVFQVESLRRNALLGLSHSLFFALLLRLLFLGLLGGRGFRLAVFFGRNHFVLVQASRAGRVGQGFHAPVVQITAPIEHDLFDTLGDRTLGDRGADTASGVEIPTARTTQVFLGGGSGNDCLAESIVDHLRVNVIQAAIDRESRSFRVAFNFPANPRVNRVSHYCSVRVCHLASTNLRTIFRFCPAST